MNKSSNDNHRAKFKKTILKRKILCMTNRHCKPIMDVKQ